MRLLATILLLGALLWTAPGWNDQTPLPLTGEATYYNPGIMQSALAYRLSIGQVQPCGACVGYVAMLRTGDIGRKVWLKHGDEPAVGPVQVVDAAAPWDYERLKDYWAIDLSWELARLWHMAGPITLTVLARPDDLPPTPESTPAAPSVLIKGPPYPPRYLRLYGELGS
jgi:hypothetical protein